MKSFISTSVKVYLLFLISFNIVYSQTLNLQTIPSKKNQFGFSFDRALYNSDITLSALSGVYQLYLNIPVSSKFNIIGNIPFINTSYEVDYGFGNYDYDKNGFGNIFIGMQTNPEAIDNRRSIITFGLFLPTANEEASFNGTFTNYYDIQKYIPNSLGLYFNYAYHKANNSGINYGLEIGPNILIPTKGENSDTEAFLHYGFSLGYQIKKILVCAEFLGIGILTQEVNNFEDRLIHTLTFGGQWKGEIITPKIFYRIYLKEQFRDMMDGVLGFGINVSIN
jgi:hypothetical protein